LAKSIVAEVQNGNTRRRSKTTDAQKSGLANDQGPTTNDDHLTTED